MSQRTINPGNMKELVAESMSQYNLGDDNGRRCCLAMEDFIEALEDLSDWMAKNQPEESFARAMFEEVKSYHPPGQCPPIEFRMGGVNPETGELQGLEELGIHHVSELPGQPGVDQLLPPKFRKKPTSH